MLFAQPHAKNLANLVLPSPVANGEPSNQELVGSLFRLGNPKRVSLLRLPDGRHLLYRVKRRLTNLCHLVATQSMPW